MANEIRTGDPHGFNKVQSSVKVPEFDKHLKKDRVYIDRNDVEITVKMKTMVWKPLMIKIIKIRLRNFDNKSLFSWRHRGNLQVIKLLSC